jgi:hypothetical protein
LQQNLSRAIFYNCIRRQAQIALRAFALRQPFGFAADGSDYPGCAQIMFE